MRLALLSLGVLSLLACNSAHSGGSCSSSGFLCQDIKTALECRTGTWLALPCRGDGGCQEANGQVTCDMNGDLAGDPCASSAVGKGLCTPDGKGTLECREDPDAGDTLLVQTNTCTSCTVSNGQVVCQQ